MIVRILTLFPSVVEAYCGESILGIARRDGALDLQCVDIRDFATDVHRTVDDRPFGGGPGMVLKPAPVFDAVEATEAEIGRCRRILLSPQGRSFDQERARALACEERMLLLCGRYEGFDERIRAGLEWEEISLGPYVLAGGELAAMAITEAAVRLIPGILGDARSPEQDSFGEDGLLDHPQYTRPRVFRGMEVPETLLSGDHGAIEAWRAEQARQTTQSRKTKDKDQ